MKIVYNNEEKEINKGTSILEAFKEEIRNSEYPVIGAMFDNEYQRLDYKLEEEGEVSLISINSKEGINIYSRTLIYIMAMAFDRVYPELKIKVNYQLQNSMFCTIDNVNVENTILDNVEKEMHNIVQNNYPIIKKSLSRKEAEEFYKENDTSRGRLQLDLEENQFIDLYYCDNYFNYLYENIAINTGIIGKFDLVKYDRGFLLRYPSKEDPLNLQKYKSGKKLLWALNEYNDIHQILDVSAVYKLNNIIENGDIKHLIMLEEALHEKKIAGIADKIAENKNIKMILIAGPSSSGKTTFAQRLGLQLKINGLKPVTISVDNYFVERKDNPKNEKGEYDFESIYAIDLDLFNRDLTALLNGETIQCPEFDFSVGTKRYKGKTMHLNDDEVLVIEGIHCLNDKLTAQIDKKQKYKIYISDLTVLNMDRLNRISTTDTRLVRRIVRDYQFRTYSAEHTLKTWPNVNRGEQQNIFPFQEEADSIFNTSLVYELAALKNVAVELLRKITPEKKEYAEAQRLINILKYFKPIPSEYIPANSLLKEFLGGGYFVY